MTDDFAKMIEFLGRSTLISTLGSEGIKKLLALSRRVEAPVGALLMKEGEAGENAMVVLEGEVEVFCDSPEGEELLATLGPGALLGEYAILGGGVRSASVRAKIKFVGLVIAKASFTLLLEEFPGLALKILEDQTKKILSLEKHIKRIDKDDRIV